MRHIPYFDFWGLTESRWGSAEYERRVIAALWAKIECESLEELKRFTDEVRVPLLLEVIAMHGCHAQEVINLQFKKNWWFLKLLYQEDPVWLDYMTNQEQPSLEHSVRYWVLFDRVAAQHAAQQRCHLLPNGDFVCYCKTLH